MPNDDFIDINFILRTMKQQRDIEKINQMVKKENQHIAEMKLYQDDDQENMLNFRGKIIKNNYKYLKKMDKADEMIRAAKEINTVMLEKNKRTLYKLEKRETSKYHKNVVEHNADDTSIEPVVNHATVNIKSQPDKIRESLHEKHNQKLAK